MYTVYCTNNYEDYVEFAGMCSWIVYLRFMPLYVKCDRSYSMYA